MADLKAAPLREWQTGTFYWLEGTHIELWQEHGSGWWFVTDSRDPDTMLLDSAYPLADAKKYASALTKTNPQLIREED